MTRDPDHELRERFRELRDATGATAPPFAALFVNVVQPRRRRRPWRSALALLPLAGVAALVLVLAVRRHRERVAVVDLATGRWEGPTDFLLQTPGAELLRSVPTFTIEGRLLP